MGCHDILYEETPVSAATSPVLSWWCGRFDCILIEETDEHEWLFASGKLILYWPFVAFWL